MREKKKQEIPIPFKLDDFLTIAGDKIPFCFIDSSNCFNSSLSITLNG